MIHAAKMISNTKGHKKYASFRIKKTDGLINCRVFLLVALDDVRCQRLYGPHFVDYVKQKGTLKAYRKSRFIIQGFNDKQDFQTQALTVTRTSQRLLLPMARSDQNLKLKNRDVDQAFANARINFQRRVFIRPSPVLGYPPHFFRRIQPYPRPSRISDILSHHV